MDFESLKQSLIDLKYPLILLLNDEQIADIFSASNRRFYVKWFLEKYGLSQINDYDDEKLANLLNNLGFCSSNDKLAFMKGTLSSTHELPIFLITLNTLKALSEPDVGNFVKVSLEDLDDLQNVNLNLFPTLGSITTYSKSERNLHLEEMEKEFEELSETLMKTQVNIEFEDTFVEEVEKKVNFEELKMAIEEFLVQTEKFAVQNEKLSLQKNENSLKNYSETFNEVLKKFHKEIKELKMYFENLRNIPEIKASLESSMYSMEINEPKERIFIEETLRTTQELLSNEN